MSAGSSSHDAACASVERTKYLMLSKSMAERSAPHVGIGFLKNSFRPLSRCASIHSGSFFFAEISRTTSSLMPRRADAPATSESAQPNLYRSGAARSGRSVVVTRIPSGRRWRQNRQRDVRRTNTIAVRDGRESLHVPAGEPAECGSLRLTQLRELLGHMLDRAVMLAQLYADAA